MTEFTPTQGRYLAFIHSYTNLHGCPPAESEIAMAMRVMPPSVNQMIRSLERLELISRVPGKPRSVQILVPEDEIPVWKRGGVVEPNPIAKGRTSKQKSGASAMKKPVDLLVLDTYIHTGPVEGEFQGTRMSRVIEIRADQTLSELHAALLTAFNRQVDRPYEFNTGKRRFDPDGSNYGIPEVLEQRNKELGRTLRSYDGDARQVKMSELCLELHQSFGYCFDSELDWYHFVSLEKLERAIGAVEYPRERRRVGKSPPQFGRSNG